MARQRVECVPKKGRRCATSEVAPGTNRRKQRRVKDRAIARCDVICAAARSVPSLCAKRMVLWYVAVLRSGGSALIVPFSAARRTLTRVLQLPRRRSALNRQMNLLLAGRIHPPKPSTLRFRPRQSSPAAARRILRRHHHVVNPIAFQDHTHGRELAPTVASVFGAHAPKQPRQRR